jgi:alkylation response protein AidB-like acyl-CoA dehydrogenase
LRLFGTEEQKRKWLPLVAKDHISAFLLTETDVGSDPARLAATATPVDGGYVLTGRKLRATNGAIADVVVVMAQVPKGDGHRGGISAFVLPYDSDGVSVEHRNAFMGLRGIENSVTRLDGVFVPEENRIGREGEGLKIALTTLNTGRLALPAICVGMAKWSTKIAREWSNERSCTARRVGTGQMRRSYDDLGPLATYMRYVERSSRKLARSIFHGMTRWQAKLEYRQAFLGRIVDIGAELFAMAATAAYADTLGRERPERRGEAQEMAELFCRQAKRRAEALFGELWDNADDANREAAARVLEGRYRSLEDGIADPSGEGPMIPDEVKESAAGDVKGSAGEGSTASGESARPTVTASAR